MRESPDLPQPPARTRAREAPHQADLPASMRLEPELWDALADICRLEDMTLEALIRRIAAAAGLPGQTSGSPGRTSAMRVFIVAYYRQACSTDDPIERSLQIVSASAQAS